MKKIICFLLTLTLIICGGATTAYASGNVLNIDKKIYPTRLAVTCTVCS